MRIETIGPEAAARLVPLNAVVQDLHARERPDVFRRETDPAAVAELFREMLWQPDHFALVAVADEGADIGYAYCQIFVNSADALTHHRRRGVLHHIAVVPAARRRGVGLALIDAALAEFRARGATEWTATWHAFNAASEALLRKAGLSVTILRGEASL